LFEIDSLPFLATSFADARKLYDATKPELQKVLASKGLTLLYTVPWPPQGLYAKKEVNSTAEMKGVTFRAYNAATSRLAELMGAVPTKIEAAELSQAFATGAVESMISSGSTGYDRKLWEHATHWYNIQAWLPKNMVIVNNDAWAKLDEATQKVVLEKAAEAETRGWAKAEELANWYVEELAKNGMTVGPAGDQLKADFAKIGETMTTEWLAKAGDTGKAAVDAYKAQ
ncbi:MAG: TRAP transporter substrate-binding protein, partial [Anderseniella sp.]